MQKFHFNFSGETYQLVILYQNRRSLKLQCIAQRQFLVSAPKKLSIEKIGSFIQDREEWIVKQSNAFHQLIHLQELSQIVEKENREKLKSEAMEFYKNEIPSNWSERPRSIQVRKQKTRWGSCSSTGTISLNVYLMQIPRELREYVYLHELCHLRHPHHQESFWRDLELLCTNAKEKRRRLSKYRFPVDEMKYFQ